MKKFLVCSGIIFTLCLNAGDRLVTAWRYGDSLLVQSRYSAEEDLVIRVWRVANLSA